MYGQYRGLIQVWEALKVLAHNPPMQSNYNIYIYKANIYDMNTQ